MTLSKKSAKFQIQKRNTMIALREQSRGVFSSFMFLHGRLPMPLEDVRLKTRHSSFARKLWREPNAKEA